MRLIDSSPTPLRGYAGFFAYLHPSGRGGARRLRQQKSEGRNWADIETQQGDPKSLWYPATIAPAQR